MTMHNDAKVGEIAERIVLVGDPNRAKHMAETYLENPVLVNRTRCAYCYTGTYEGVRVSVMAVGMGGPSMLIYATELCRDYGCKILVRAAPPAATGRTCATSTSSSRRRPARPAGSMTTSSTGISPRWRISACCAPPTGSQRR